VPVRIHGEHGRDVEDLQGDSRHYQRLRRFYSPFVHRYVALSKDLAGYLTGRVGIAPARVEQIYNGVDAERFHPASGGPQAIEGCPFDPARHFVVGTVGRMQTVKHQTLLARAFVRALALQPAVRDRLRLTMIGEGPLRAQAQAILAEAGVADLAWLPGERIDVPDVMRSLHGFVLPSLAEGISNTILEAMASGLPVIATGVGGNAELVTHGRNGEIVPPDDVEALAQALLRLAADPARAAAMGREGRAEVERRFSLQAMVEAYQGLYDRQLRKFGVRS
jgi:sugar transferase (PEP-CTERM/EpsH1 system associated)